jgi:hypothetical protein
MATKHGYGYGRAVTISSQTSCFNDYAAEAQRRFPFSAKRGWIFGTGEYLLISKCVVPWRVFCFDTVQQRAEAIDRWRCNGCGTSRCSQQHDLVNL